ncbi:MAG: hypothetical protein N2254_09590 [bacterium]|nr:hypothetical protein [bacterium]
MNRGKKLIYLCLALAAVISSCSGEKTETVSIKYPKENCNILSKYENEPDEVKDECFFPFPFTQFYSNGKLNIPKELFKKPEGYPEMNLERINSFDGFSPANQIMFWYPKGFSRNSLPKPEETTDERSAIQLIEYGTGERIPVFAEPDARSSPPFQILFIRPLKRMKTSSRYIVVMKKGLKDSEGKEIQSPLFFKAVLENKDIKVSGTNQDVGKWKEHFNQIMSFLESQGIKRNELLVAWDFKTASEEKILKEHMLEVRKKVYEYQDKITFIIDEVKDLPHINRQNIPEVYRNLIQKAVVGRFYAPKVDGSGNFEAKFLLNIPRCTFANPTSYFKPMIFGHGLFGSTAELDSHNIIFSAEYFCTPVIGSNWVGIDINALSEIFDSASAKKRHMVQIVEYITDNLKQGHANFLSLAILIKKNEFWNEIKNRTGNFNIDTQNPVYYGISNGSIQGSIFMTLTKDVQLGVLDVGGGVWTSMLERNRSWDRLRPFLYPSGSEWEIEVKKVMAIVQILFDILDPITFATYITRGSKEFDITPKKIIYREALYDEQVANFATRAFVRTAGIPAIAELPEDVFGIEKVDASAGYDGSVYLQVDPKLEGIPEYQYENVSLEFLKKPDPKSKIVRRWWPMLPNEGEYIPPHEVPRCVLPVLEIQKRFYEEGKIYQLCSNKKCDPD